MPGPFSSKNNPNSVRHPLYHHHIIITIPTPTRRLGRARPVCRLCTLCAVSCVLTRFRFSNLHFCFFDFSKKVIFLIEHLLVEKIAPVAFISLTMPPSCRPSVTSCGVIFLLLCSLSSLSWPATAFTTPSLVPRNPLSRFLSAPALGVANLRDADFVEMMLGGERYEMVPLPDSMVETTLFVGNLNEFVKDDDLSNLFQTVSTLQYLPACVCRRPNRDSLKYGFVAFPTVEEKVVSTTLKTEILFLEFKE